MNSLRLLLAVALVVLILPAAGAAGDGHYVPKAGDQFHYAETIFLNGGIGNYTGYTESTYLNGTLGVTAVAANGTESASYSSSGRWSNNTGSSQSLLSSGTFTFSATSFLYVQGTDNQTGYTNPYVWFYMDNTLADGATFYLLNTQMSVTSTDASYALASTPGKYVSTIEAQGTGSFQRDDEYGVFTASYTWTSYFDPATGYVVGYLYTEQDRDSSGDGFTMTDLLYVTSTSYPLTSAAAPSTPSSSSPSFLPYLVVVVIVLVLIAVLVVALRSRSRRTTPLPRHSAGGAVSYAPPPGSVPPPIGLIPNQQPPVPQVVLRETVKVNCRYCGTLIDTTDSVCPNCGAPRT
jgi:hypothetical protein